MLTMNEAAEAHGVCKLCNALSTKLCDGKMPDGRTCDARICRAHTRTVALVTTSRFGRRTCDTRDLCPDCVAAGRTP